MDDLIKALLVALQTGALEVTITVRHRTTDTDKSAAFLAHCEVCKWSAYYETALQRKKGLTAKRQHCANEDCPAKHGYQSWLHSDTSGKK